MSSWSIIKWVGLFVAVAVLLFQLSERPKEAGHRDSLAPGLTEPRDVDEVERTERELLSAIAREEALEEAKRLSPELDDLEAEVARWDKVVVDFKAGEAGKRLLKHRVAVDRLRPFFTESRPTAADVAAKRGTLSLIHSHLIASNSVPSEYQPGERVVTALADIRGFTEGAIEKFKTDYAMFRRAVWELEQSTEEQTE
jgi:hypothetical protein